MTIYSIPAPVALALIAIIGYFIGRRGREQSQLEAERAKLELKRAKAVAADMYLRLHYAIDVAKAAGKPKENVQRDVKSDAGELDESNFEEILYEGYGPGGRGRAVRNSHRQSQSHCRRNPQDLRTG